MLTLKHLPISSFNENIVYLHKDCVAYKLEDIKFMTKVEVHGGPKPIYAFLNIVNDESLVTPNQLALNNEAFEQIKLPEGTNVSIALTPPPPSINSIKRKISGNILNSNEYATIVNDITERRYSNMDIASFLVSSGAFMTPPEVLALTEALVGEQTINWDNEGIVVDHHCLGGIPGNKTDIIITAIVSAYGLPIPKTASRSLSSCAGVADTMSVLANVDLDENKLKKLVSENRGALVCHSGLQIAAANRLISSVERQIGITQQQHLVSSILAIKLAMGITHLVIDIPVGINSRIKNTQDAMRLRKLIEYVGDQTGIMIDAVITDGSEPIGNGIGAVLEARDVMKVLRNKDDAPQDLREKSLFLAGRIIDFDPQLRGGQGYFVAKEILNSGRALESINKIIHAQGKAPQPTLGNLTREIVATTNGYVESINNTRINQIGVLAGASQNAGAGLDLLKKVGDKVVEGEPLFRIHATHQSDFGYASTAADGNNGYIITSK